MALNLSPDIGIIQIPDKLIKINNPMEQVYVDEKLDSVEYAQKVYKAELWAMCSPIIMATLAVIFSIFI